MKQNKNILRAALLLLLGIAAPEVRAQQLITDNGDGTYTITMPAGNVTVTADVKKLLAHKDISVEGIADQDWTGSAIEPAIVVKDGETDITSECDITITDNTAVGTANVAITAKAESTEYADGISTTFSILRRMENLFRDSYTWTGYVAQEDLALPSGLTAYTVTALNGATATATALDYIPQDVPVLLGRTDNTVNLYRASAGSGTAPTENLLQAASSTNQPTAFQDYVLYQDAFYLVSGGTLADGKVFLPAGGGTTAPRLNIALGNGETTSLTPDPSPTGEGSGYWYTLDGRKVNGQPLKKGLYIHNGRKVVEK
jgi:hypothetical protein